MAAGSSYPAAILDENGIDRINGTVSFSDSTNQPVSPSNPVTSGNLSQLAAWSSGTAQQNAAGRPVTVVIAPTGDATNNAATVDVALSPDNVTYTTVATWSLAAAVNNTGAITTIVCVPVPQSWYIKLTLSHSTVAQSYYY